MGIEAKAMLRKAHINKHDAAATLETSKRVTFIHCVLEMPVRNEPMKEQLTLPDVSNRVPKYWHTHTTLETALTY